MLKLPNITKHACICDSHSLSFHARASQAFSVQYKDLHKCHCLTYITTTPTHNDCCWPDLPVPPSPPPLTHPTHLQATATMAGWASVVTKAPTTRAATTTPASPAPQAQPQQAQGQARLQATARQQLDTPTVDCALSVRPDCLVYSPDVVILPEITVARADCLAKQ